MPELVVTLPEQLHRDLLNHLVDWGLSADEVVAEALQLLLEKREALSERERARRILLKKGLIYPPSEKDFGASDREIDRVEVERALAKLKTPLSEDIIRERR